LRPDDNIIRLLGPGVMVLEKAKNNTAKNTSMVTPNTVDLMRQKELM
jgi:hypothetical protein